MRSLALPCSLLALAMFAPREARAKTQEIAVLELAVDGADPVIGRQLSAQLAEVLGARPNVKVMAPDDLRALLEQEAKKQALGCTEAECLAEIAGALGADLLVSGRVSKLDEGYALSLSLVDAARARALGHANETFVGETIELLELMAPMVDRLFSSDSARLVGSLAFEGGVDGSRVVVDGQLRGVLPIRIDGVPVGARRVEVLEDGYRPLVRFAVVKTGGVTLVPLRQEAEPSAPLHTRWWFWSAIAVGVAGAAVSAIALLGGGEEPPGVPSGINVSVSSTVLEGGR